MFVVRCLAVAVARNSRFIRKVQSRLASHGEEVTSAAGVAELLDGKNVEQVLATSRKLFLVVPANRLRKEDWCEASGLKPNAILAASAVKANLGDADAFISHSWHDNPELKWAMLQKWRENFKRTHRGKEPKLWVDKYCIDQKNIAESLACLPVYLAGCKKLVIFCGKTYLCRLWCLVEIFVFLEMGGRLEKLEVHLLMDDADHSLDQELANFDPQNARCFTDYDTKRLQEVIAVTGYPRIKQLVHDVFLQNVQVARESAASK